MALHDSEPTQTFDDTSAAETDRNPDAIVALSVLPVRIAAVVHHEIQRLDRVILRGQHQGRPTACGVVMLSVWIGPSVQEQFDDAKELGFGESARLLLHHIGHQPLEHGPVPRGYQRIQNRAFISEHPAQAALTCSSACSKLTCSTARTTAAATFVRREGEVVMACGIYH